MSHVTFHYVGGHEAERQQVEKCLKEAKIRGKVVSSAEERDAGLRTIYFRQGVTLSDQASVDLGGESSCFLPLLLKHKLFLIFI